MSRSPGSAAEGRGRPGALQHEVTRLELVEVTCNLCGSARYCVLMEAPLSDVPGPKDLAAALRCTTEEYGSFGRIVRCLDCGLIYRNPQESEIEGGYAEVVDEAYVSNEVARRATYEKTLDLMAREAPVGGRLLDVGCYTGTFLDLARAHGWHVEGLEPSEWAARIARERHGLMVTTGTIEQAEWPAGSLDVVTLWDVLEHLRDPRGGLERIREWLTPRGALWLSTMDVGSPFARLLGRRWPHYLRMHLWYFTRDTLRRLLSETGFETVGAWPHVRVLRLGYLARKLCCCGVAVGALAGGVVSLLRASEAQVSVSVGDVITVLARKGSS
jgi:2-polyprenyl-3-methyl-5-hydroxy-6-metoxy-1,4-benzoquinol methylase